MYPRSLSAIADQSVRKRIKTERKIVTALIDHALAEGYDLAVFDGETRHPATRDRRSIINAAMETDEDRLLLHKNGDLIGVVCLVYGNDGHDVIADYSVELEPFMAPINAIADRLSYSA